MKAALGASDLDRLALQSALSAAEKDARTEIAALVKAALDARPADPAPSYMVDPAVLPVSSPHTTPGPASAPVAPGWDRVAPSRPPP